MSNHQPFRQLLARLSPTAQEAVAQQADALLAERPYRLSCSRSTPEGVEWQHECYPSLVAAHVALDCYALEGCWDSILLTPEPVTTHATPASSKRLLAAGGWLRRGKP
jgi:hypothetical protein